jgi:hypothetical protein
LVDRYGDRLGCRIGAVAAMYCNGLASHTARFPP